MRIIEMLEAFSPEIAGCKIVLMFRLTIFAALLRHVGMIYLFFLLQSQPVVPCMVGLSC
jgi:hypothetical protein